MCTGTPPILARLGTQVLSPKVSSPIRVAKARCRPWVRVREELGRCWTTGVRRAAGARAEPRLGTKGVRRARAAPVGAPISQRIRQPNTGSSQSAEPAAIR